MIKEMTKKYDWPGMEEDIKNTWKDVRDVNKTNQIGRKERHCSTQSNRIVPFGKNISGPNRTLTRINGI